MTQYEIIEMAKEAGIEWVSGLNGDGYHINHPNDLKHFAKLVAEKEREECAKVCERTKVEDVKTGNALARLIRARGQPQPKKDTTDAEWIARCLAASTLPKEFRPKEFK